MWLSIFMINLNQNTNTISISIKISVSTESDRDSALLLPEVILMNAVAMVAQLWGQLMGDILLHTSDTTPLKRCEELQ